MANGDPAALRRVRTALDCGGERSHLRPGTGWDGQSAVDLDDPTHLVFDYMRRIGDLIDAIQPASPAPIRALHVGGAAMSIPRYVAATRPRSAQIVLEPDEILIAQVRVEAPCRGHSGIKVRATDGAAGIRLVGTPARISSSSTPSTTPACLMNSPLPTSWVRWRACSPGVGCSWRTW